MGRTFLFLGLMALAAFGAQAGDTRVVTDATLPVRPAADAPATLRPSESMPRYATMIPPSADDLAPAPAAAPVGKVDVAPSSPSAAVPPPVVVQRQPEAQRLARAVVPAPPAGLRVSDDSNYRLGTGDKLHVTVFNEADLTGDFTIDGQGFVRLPLVGQVPAAGLTSSGLEARIGEAFVSGGYLISPRVSVEITSYRPFYILGEVAKPGEYPYVNAMTAPNAIALAGGYTDRATEATILVRRLGETRERELRADETTRIYPGDVVRVERSSYWSLMTLLAPLISPFATTAYILK
jgi:polysaccharide export outer membrane protein